MQDKLDVSTVISICPIEINETKPGLFPGTFHIDACKNEDEPNLLYIFTAVHLVQLMDERPSLRVDTPSYVVAESVVKDFIDGQLWTTLEARPGITWSRGEISRADLKVRFPDLIKNLKMLQRNWYKNLVEQTNNEWNRTKNHKVASSTARFAAQQLGLEVEWAFETTLPETGKRCPACQSVVGIAVVCPVCKCILDKEKHKTLTFA